MPNARAYLILLIDTKPILETPDWDPLADLHGTSQPSATKMRKLSVAIFGEATPTHAGHVHPVVICTSSAQESYAEAAKGLRKLVMAPEPNGYSWCKPLFTDSAPDLTDDTSTYRSPYLKDA
jgi:hypothetical protein